MELLDGMAWEQEYGIYQEYGINHDSVIENKLEFLKNQLETIQNDFRKNLKPMLTKFEYNDLTRAMLENIQREIDFFLERNELKISVYVSTLNQNLIIIGKTLVDELVWEQIQ